MLDSDHYRSLAKASEGFYREKGSKFLSFAYPVETEEEIKDKLDSLKKQYHDARHHCYAFVLKPEEGREETYRAHDGGEPPHTAGDPILNQIRSFQLHDTLIVVVRYFGGTKLGVSGLIQAYKTAAADAISHNNIIEKVMRQSLEIQYTYPATSEVVQVIQRYELTIEAQRYGENCYYKLGAKLRQKKEIIDQLQQIKGVRML